MKTTISSSTMDRTAKAYVHNKTIQSQIDVLDDLVQKGEKTAEDIRAEKQRLTSQLTQSKKWRINFNYLFITMQVSFNGISNFQILNSYVFSIRS